MKKVRLAWIWGFICIIGLLSAVLLNEGDRETFFNLYSGIAIGSLVIFWFFKIREIESLDTTEGKEKIFRIDKLPKLKDNVIPDSIEIIRNDNNVVRELSYEMMNDGYRTILKRMICFTLFLGGVVFIPFLIGMLPMQPLSDDPLIMVYCSASAADMLLLASMIIATACNILFLVLPFLEKGEINFKAFDLRNSVEKLSKEINVFYEKSINKKVLIIQKENIIYDGDHVPYLLIQYTTPNHIYRKAVDVLFLLLFVSVVIFVWVKGGIKATGDFWINAYPYVIFIYYALISNGKYEENVNKHRVVFGKNECLESYHYVSKKNYQFDYSENGKRCSKMMTILVLPKFNAIAKVLSNIADFLEGIRTKVLKKKDK